MSDEIKSLHDKLSRDWEEMKAQMTRSDADAKAAVERVNAALTATETKLTEEKQAREAAEKALEVKFARLEQLERAAVESKDGPTAEEKAFESFFRKGEDRMTADERKSLATDNDSEGGYTVPNPVEGRFIEKLIEFSPVRAEVSVETIGSGNAWVAPAEGSQNFAAGKVGERDSRSETTAGKMRFERIPVHEFYANPFITQTMLDDTSFDVEGWISRRVGTARAVAEGAYLISGTGEGEHEGLLTNADITTVYQPAATTVLEADGLINLVFDLPEMYARNGVFLWKRSTTAAIRKLKDVTSGQYLWQPGINGGTSPSVLGYRYVECIDMPAATTGLYAVLFGDFRAGYRLVDRKGITLVRDPYSSKPFIEMYFTWRSGGQVVLAEAIRKLKIATS